MSENLQTLLTPEVIMAIIGIISGLIGASKSKLAGGERFKTAKRVKRYAEDKLR